MALSDVNLSGVVDIEFSPGSWEELSHVGFHLGLGDLLGDKEDLGSGLLAAVLVEDLGTGGLSSGVGDWDGVVVEDVVHDIIFVSTVVAGGRSVGGGGGWWTSGNLLDRDGFSRGNESGENENGGVFHFLF